MNNRQPVTTSSSLQTFTGFLYLFAMVLAVALILLAV